MSKPSIEELAMKHMLSHPNDKSGPIISKMRGTYGRQATKEAIRKAADTLDMCDPEGWKVRRGKLA